MTKLNSKHHKHFKRLTQRIEFNDIAFENCIRELHEHFDISPNTNTTYFNIVPENYNEFYDICYENLTEHKERQDTLNAKRAANLLIGYNIARRGKKLHASKIEKQLKKIPAPHAEIIQTAMSASNFTSPSPASFKFPHLHSELYKKYGVLLLDEKYYKYLIFLIERGPFTVNRKTYALTNLFHKKITSKQK